MKTVVRLVFIAGFSFLLVFSAWKIFDIHRNYKVGQDTYESLQEYVSIPIPTTPEPTPEPVPDETVSEDPVVEEEKFDVSWPQVDFEHLLQINPDVVGWIYIENTDINFPVVQAADNEYYLTRMVDGTWNSSGSIFLDASAAADLSDQHSIIFGHNMKNGTMFASLMNYKDLAYFEEHPEILLLTPTCNYLIRIFSGHVADASVNAWEREFDDIRFEDWLSAVTEKSVFLAEHQPQSDNLIVTLSTCSYEFSNAKFLIHGYIAYKESPTETIPE